MSWPHVALGDVAEFINGFAFKPTDWEQKGRPIIRIQNLTKSSNILNRTTKHVPEKYHVTEGELLVSWSASLGVFEHEGEDALVNQHIFRVRENPDRVVRSYLRHMIDSSIVSMANIAHGSTMKHINRQEFLEHSFPLPPLDEQRRIAGILDAADALRRRRREALARLDTLPGAIFAEMFGDPTKNPRQLPCKPLGEFAMLERGKSKHRPRNDPQLLGGPHPLVQTGDVANADGYIECASSSYSDFGLKQSRKWPAGTLCITIAANIADGAILTFPACFPDSVVGCTFREPYHTEFIRVWLMSVKGRIEKVAPAVAQKNINLKILGAIPIIVPPEKEIQKFATIVQRIREDRERSVRQCSELETLFASLQSRAFAGEL